MFKGDLVGGCGGVKEGGSLQQAESERVLLYLFMYIINIHIAK